MQELLSFYTAQINTCQGQLLVTKKQLFASSMLRLAIFCLAIIAIYFLYGNTKWVIGIVLVTAIVFLFLVSRHTDLQHRRDQLSEIIRINETEIKVLRWDFQNLPEGNRFKDTTHYFSQDIDLFGKGSFYQYCNRTALEHGGETLAALLKENSEENIRQKQEAIQELAKIAKWRQNFSAIASLTKTETSIKTIVKWLVAYQPFLPAFTKVFP